MVHLFSSFTITFFLNVFSLLQVCADSHHRSIGPSALRSKCGSLKYHQYQFIHPLYIPDYLPSALIMLRHLHLLSHTVSLFITR